MPIERRADRLREIHHLVDLLGEHLAERAAEDGEVLREDEDLPTVDRAPAGDDTIGERAGLLDAEAVRAMTGEHVELDERAGIEQFLESLACGELAPRVLTIDGLSLPAWSACSRSSPSWSSRSSMGCGDRHDRRRPRLPSP